MGCTDENIKESPDTQHFTGEEATNEVSKENTTSSIIYVYICGSIMNPGVYSVEANTRLNDIIDMAGGFTQDASREYLNLAEIVSDGQKITVPSQEDVKNNNLEIINGGSSNGNGIVNINTASKDILMTLPGIGQAKADDIITYRDKNGKFATIEDIMKISGIKENLFNKIKDLIKV